MTSRTDGGVGREHALAPTRCLPQGEAGRSPTSGDRAGTRAARGHTVSHQLRTRLALVDRAVLSQRPLPWEPLEQWASLDRWHRARLSGRSRPHVTSWGHFSPRARGPGQQVPLKYRHHRASPGQSRAQTRGWRGGAHLSHWHVQRAARLAPHADPRGGSWLLAGHVELQQRLTWWPEAPFVTKQPRGQRLH